MAKLNAGKLKELARGLKNDSADVKKGGDAPKQTETKKKIVTTGDKVSGRKS